MELGVDKPYIDCNDDVNAQMSRIDKGTDSALYLTPLLDAGLKILAYNGDLDVICNYLSGIAWTENTAWKHQADFKTAQWAPIKLQNGTDYGYSKSFQNFQFIRFYDAGHLVPTDKPVESQYMINTFMGLI